MGATFLQTIKERYEQAALSYTWPTFYSGVQKEGAARTFPNVVVEHLGEKPEYVQGVSGPPLAIAHVVGRIRIVVFAVGLTTAETLMGQIQTEMEALTLHVGNDVDVRLFRGEYKVNPTTQRGPNDEIVFAAMTPYQAMFNP